MITYNLHNLRNGPLHWKQAVCQNSVTTTVHFKLLWRLLVQSKWKELTQLDNFWTRKTTAAFHFQMAPHYNRNAELASTKQNVSHKIWAKVEESLWNKL